MNSVNKEIRLILSKSDIRRVHLSHPDWRQPQVSDSYGIVREFHRARHYHDRQHQIPYFKVREKFDFDEACQFLLAERAPRIYDVSSRRNYSQHIRDAIADLQASQAVLAIGNGNLLSNLGIVGYSRKQNGEALKLHVAWEEERIQRDWLYSCLYYTQDGEYGIAKFNLNDVNSLSAMNIAWLTSGQPILWGGEAANTEHLIAETYDIRHIYQLRATVGSDAAKRRAYDRIQKFMHTWIDVFRECSQHESTQPLTTLATMWGLDVEERYLQSAIGVDGESNLYIAQKHGSMKGIAETLKGMGAKRGILLDQGGSVGTFYLSNTNCKENDLNCEFILRSRDFREERLCILIFELTTDQWDEA